MQTPARILYVEDHSDTLPRLMRGLWDQLQVMAAQETAMKQNNEDERNNNMDRRKFIAKTVLAGAGNMKDIVVLIGRGRLVSPFHFMQC